MPVQKIACPDEQIEYDSEHAGARHTIFAGTTVLELDGEVEAIVSNTGVDTSKGALSCAAFCGCFPPSWLIPGNYMCIFIYVCVKVN